MRSPFALDFGDWGLEAQYFGVPFAILPAWFWVVFSFSIGASHFSYAKDSPEPGSPPSQPISLDCSGVLGTNAFVVFVVPDNIRSGVIGITIASALAIIIFKRPALSQRPVDPIAFWVPFLTHAYVLIAGIISGWIGSPIDPLVVGILMFIIAIRLAIRN